MGVILGYIFSETQYYLSNGKKVYRAIEFKRENFNYIIGISGFVIISGVSYLFLNRKNK